MARRIVVVRCSVCDATTPHVRRWSLRARRAVVTCERCRDRNRRTRRSRRPRLDGTTTIDLF